MKKRTIKPLLQFLTLGGIFSVLVAGNCNKNNDVPLPQIGGYNNSNEVAAANLKAYWPLDGNGTESKSGVLPTSTVNVTYAAGGIKGQAATFSNGYIYYASAVGGALTSTSHLRLVPGCRQRIMALTAACPRPIIILINFLHWQNQANSGGMLIY